MARNLGWSAYAWRRRLRARGGVKTGVPDGVFIEQEAYYGTRVEAMRCEAIRQIPMEANFLSFAWKDREFNPTGRAARPKRTLSATRLRAKFGRREISVSETSPLIIDCSVHRLRQFPPLESPRKPPLLHSSVHARLYVRYPQAMGV